LLFAVLAALAKNPKNAGPEDAPIRFPLPVVDAMSPEDELKTFRIADGFEIQLVAAEPMVEDPIALSFDAQGRIWVLEMRGYMHDIEGAGEDQPLGRVKLLTDTDGDGKADKASIFLDGLFMPRGLMVWRDGVIVAEPPNLFFVRDTNGDGVGDERTLIANNYGTRGGQPEHMANCPTFALDNWIYSAAYGMRARFTGGKWVTEATRSRGQWGLSQDDFGRLCYNYNSDLLRADLVPANYLARNPNFTPSTGSNVKIMNDQTVWPSHPTPGVNRGYSPGTLRDDGTLKTVTATCGPGVYRADLFGPDFLNNVFIPEPSANLIKRVIVEEKSAQLTAANAYDGREFWTSTDERFRPVNCYTGPDGALYVVDLYRGVLQHKAFLTNYLIKNIKERKLEQPVNRGRIWRVIPTGSKSTSVKVKADPLMLEHPNGWVRDTAQRLMVEHPDPKTTRQLEKLASSSKNPLARMHALWTLEGMGKMESSIALTALADADANVRATAVRLCEPYLVPASRPEVLPDLLKLADDPAFEVRLQFALSLSPVPEKSVEEALVKILQKDPRSPLLRESAISGLRGRELEFLESILAAKTPDKNLLLTLAQCVMSEKRPARVKKLLDLAAAQEKTARAAILEGMGPQKGRVQTKLIFLEERPTSLEALKQSHPDLVKEFEPRLAWPGKPGVVIPPPPRELTISEKSRYEEGKNIYANICAACHQPTGLGQDGLAPPLVDSEWVLGPPTRLPRILMHGVAGPISVTGAQFRLEMPGLPDLSDHQIAAVLTYIRREWDHGADPLTDEQVQQIRAQEKSRTQPWTALELLKIK
jgi:mono/diheme cytochrome c family protein/glucose/arabinose dehydrogenase/HEAT repeat protein